LLHVWIDSALPSRTDDWYRQTGVSAPEKIGSVARPAVKSKARETGAGVNGVRITGAVVGLNEAGGMSPQALRVNVPAPIPISLIKSRRVSLLMVKFSFYFAMLPV